MKRSHKIAAGIAVSLGLALASLAYAHPGQTGWGMGGGMMGGMGPGAMAGYGAGYGPQFMSPEERATFREKMRNGTEYGPGPRGYGPGNGMGPGTMGGYGPQGGYGRGPR
ncbi:MAG: hypothetical protein HY527_01280 [Betaproteobacteria bacterium]|nr:hypothetical protein [Betaproteobacteria bacterium]